MPKSILHASSGGDYESEVRRVSAVGIFCNLGLAAFKLAAGILGCSTAMIGDAIHSASDIAGGLIVIVGVALAERQADEDHPYGHERLECIASLLLSAILLIAGLALGRDAAASLLSGAYRMADAPGRIALIAAILSILLKEALCRYTLAAAGRLGSGALRAEALHHRSDALSSVGALVGIAGARLGLLILEPAATLFICFFILKAAYDVFRDAVGHMVDRTGGEELENRIRKEIASFPQVLGVDLLRTREFGRRVYVDLELSMDGDATLRETHRVAEAVHDRLESRFPQIKHVMIHVNPAERRNSGNAREL